MRLCSQRTREVGRVQPPPIVKRIHQWDWQGKLATDDPVMCSAPTAEGRPMNGGRCTWIAKYRVDGEPMCAKHAKVVVFDKVIEYSEG